MRLHNIAAIARKEVRHLVRDARSLALMFLLPAMMLFLYGYAIRLDIVDAPSGCCRSRTTRCPTSWPPTSRPPLRFG